MNLLVDALLMDMGYTPEELEAQRQKFVDEYGYDPFEDDDLEDE